MMTGIKLRLDQWMEGNMLENGVAAKIYGISNEGRSVSRLVQKLVLPAGAQEYSDISLEPGNYLIEATLPSGDTISEMVSVTKGEDPPEVVLQAERSPHEWMSWQHFMGNVERGQDAYKTRLLWAQSALPEVPPTDAQIEENFNFSAAPEFIPPMPWRALEVDIFVLPSSLKSLDGRLDAMSVDPLLHAVANVLTSEEEPEAWQSAFDMLVDYGQGELAPVVGNISCSDEDELYQRYDFSFDVLSSISTSGSMFDYRTDEFDRFYALADGNGAVALCVLPVPWQEIGYGEEAHVELLIDKASLSRSRETEGGSFQGNPRIPIVVQDRQIGSLIGYLGHGDIASALTVLQHARDLLYAKVQNPMAAAAGGYVLINARRAREEPDDPQEWFRWVGNLMNWFPWLPDGAIQHGWLKLLARESNDDDFAEARRSFLEGFRRGIPLYSVGVKMLYEGLTLFASNARAEEQPDEEIETALETVRRLALRTNMDLPFTVIRLF